MTSARRRLIPFLASPAGQALRLAGGAAGLIVALQMPEGIGSVVGLISVLLIVTAALDVCFISPLLGGPVRGDEMRQMAYPDGPDRPDGWAGSLSGRRSVRP